MACVPVGGACRGRSGEDNGSWALRCEDFLFAGGGVAIFCSSNLWDSAGAGSFGIGFGIISFGDDGCRAGGCFTGVLPPLSSSSNSSSISVLISSSRRSCDGKCIGSVSVDAATGSGSAASSKYCCDSSTTKSSAASNASSSKGSSRLRSVLKLAGNGLSHGKGFFRLLVSSSGAASTFAVSCADRILSLFDFGDLLHVGSFVGIVASLILLSESRPPNSSSSASNMEPNAAKSELCAVGSSCLSS